MGFLAAVVALVWGPTVVRLLNGEAGHDRWLADWRAAYPLSAEGAPEVKRPPEPTARQLIVEAARARIGKTIHYDASYRSLPYPMGDLPQDRGACTDLIVRSLRAAGVDLQQLIHGDMRRDRTVYPALWGRAAPDANIDHRRSPNQMCYLLRHWVALSTQVQGGHWKPGDLVYWRLPVGRLHCGVVTERTGASGRPMVIHNMDRPREEDCLGAWQIVAHFRHPRAGSVP